MTTQDKPLVSILMACYNAEPFVEAAIKSCLEQTYRNLEVVVVNDGSTDGSLDILRRLESDRVHVLTQENKGQSETENVAFAASKGRYVSYFDADDLLHPEKIERQIATLAEHPDDDAITGGEWGRFYRDPANARFLADGLWQDHQPVEWLLRAWEHNEMMHPGAWLIPRRIVERVGGYNPELSLINDFEFYTRVILGAKMVRFTPGARSYYRSGLDSALSHTKSLKAWRSAYTSRLLAARKLLEHEDSHRTRLACANIMQAFVYESHPTGRELHKDAESFIREMGGATLQPIAGPMFHRLRKLIGWRAASHVQHFAYRMGYLERGRKKLRENEGVLD